MANQISLLEFLFNEHFFKVFCLLDHQIFYKQNKKSPKTRTHNYSVGKTKKSNQPRNGKKTFQT